MEVGRRMLTGHLQIEAFSEIGNCEVGGLRNMRQVSSKYLRFLTFSWVKVR